MINRLALRFRGGVLCGVRWRVDDHIRRAPGGEGAAPAAGTPAAPLPVVREFTVPDGPLKLDLVTARLRFKQGETPCGDAARVGGRGRDHRAARRHRVTGTVTEAEGSAMADAMLSSALTASPPALPGALENALAASFASKLSLPSVPLAFASSPESSKALRPRLKR